MDPAGPAAGRAAIVAVDDDAAALGRVRRELERRYAADYDLVCAGSPGEAVAALERIAGEGGDVALVLADQWMPGTTGTDLLQEARRMFPHVKRGLLVDWGAWADARTKEAILRAMALGTSTTTCSSPGARPTSSSIARSPSSCTSGRAPGAAGRRR